MRRLGIVFRKQRETSIVESKFIGDGTVVRNFVHIMEGAVIGNECHICDYVFIEDGAVIGNRVTIKNMVQVWRGVVIEDDCFIGPSVVFTNDKFPKSKNRNFKLLTTVVESKVSIGANATILPGIRIGEGAIIGAGSVVTKNVEPYTTVLGNPARLVVRAM